MTGAGLGVCPLMPTTMPQSPQNQTTPVSKTQGDFDRCTLGCLGMGDRKEQEPTTFLISLDQVKAQPVDSNPKQRINYNRKTKGFDTSQS